MIRDEKDHLLSKGIMTTTSVVKKPSKNLLKAISDVVGNFLKTAKSIDRVFSIGRNEGFNDVEIGNLIRKEMLAANYDPRTIRRALPLSAKHIEMVREQKTFADKMSAINNKKEILARHGQESDHGTSIKTCKRMRSTNLVSRVHCLPIEEQHQDSTWKASTMEQLSHKLSASQPRQSVQGTNEENTIFGSARISALPEDTELLRFEIPIPKAMFWQYVEDHIGENQGNQVWINCVMNKETGKILSQSMGRIETPQI